MPRLPTDEGSIATTGLRAWLASRSDGHRLHAGVDLPAGPGDAIRAPAAGRIVLTFESNRPRDADRPYSRPFGWSGYGPHGIVIQGDDGWVHLLSHTGPPHVRAGERVDEGALLAHGSPLAHVHWEVRTRLRPPQGVATVEVCADPASWLAGAPVVWGEPGHTWRAPPRPVGDRRTPRRFRTTWRGPVPPPFPHPAPVGPVIV